MEKELTNMERMDEKIDFLIGNKKDKKGFKIPFRARVSKANCKKNYVTILRVNENRNVNFEKVQILDQTMMVDGIPRLAPAEAILNYKNKPFMILPSWSVEPFSPSENYKTSLTNGSNSAGYRLLLARMQGEAIKLKKKIGGLGMSIGALIIGALIVYALISG